WYSTSPAAGGQAGKRSRTILSLTQIEAGRLSACPCRRYNAKQPIRTRATSGSDRFRPWGRRRLRAAGMSMATGRCGVNYSDQPPSRQWSVLKYQGETIAEVWFKPEANPLALTFRIPRASFQAPRVGPRLTPENLLKAVGLE